MSVAPPDQLSTSRLCLRKLRASDAPSMFEEYASDPRVTRYLVAPTQNTVEETKHFIAERLQEWTDAKRWTYALTLQAQEDRAIGRLALRATPEGISVGYALAHRLAGNGLATEAVRAICPLARALSTRVYARVVPDNTASIRVLEKCGFTRSEIRPQSIVLPNLGPEPRDCVIYLLG